MNLRTKKSLEINPKIPHYPNDGRGRDTYISYAVLKDFYYLPPQPGSYPPHVTQSQDLSLRKPLKKYLMDGQGRDYYVSYTINLSTNKYSGDVNIENTLRTPPLPIHVPKGKSKFEKKLIDRIFYGKCDGMKTRYMSPKVVFAKKRSEILEEERLKREEEERLRREEEEKLFQQTEENNEKKKKNAYSRDPLPTEDDLKESVKRIFLFGNKTIDENNKVKDIAWY